MRNKAIITEATAEDIRELVPILRKADRDEILAVTNRDVEEVLLESLQHSVLAWTGRVNGELLCVFGVVSLGLMTGNGIPWLLGSGHIDKYARTFMRQTKPYMKKMRRVCPTMINYVDVRNIKSIAWLKRLGFSILDAEPWGVSGMPFYRFEMRS